MATKIIILKQSRQIYGTWLELTWHFKLGIENIGLIVCSWEGVFIAIYEIRGIISIAALIIGRFLQAAPNSMQLIQNQSLDNKLFYLQAMLSKLFLK